MIEPMTKSPIETPSFNDFNLPEKLNIALHNMGYETPTPVQQKAIPLAISGHDILASAQTGTGKTGAFSVPMIAHLMNKPGSTALILTPTRELAMQIQVVVDDMIKKAPMLKSVLLIGGESMPKQTQKLQSRPRIIIGTPGRINDHLRSAVFLNKVDFVVFDEADRMLDMGFSIQLDEILKFVPNDRQTLMFSATFAPAILKFARTYLNDPQRVEIEPDKKSADNIDHKIVKVDASYKYETLLEELKKREGSIIIFAKTKIGTDKLAQKLKKDGFKVNAIHGDLHQHKRKRVLENFRDSKYRILVATDVAARGLDVPHIEHVINYDLPQNPEDYVHRIGRTARAGAQGHALCLLTPHDREIWERIQRLIGFEGGDNQFQGKAQPKKKGSGGKGGFVKNKRPFNKRFRVKGKPEGDDNRDNRGENRSGKKPHRKGSGKPKPSVEGRSEQPKERRNEGKIVAKKSGGKPSGSKKPSGERPGKSSGKSSGKPAGKPSGNKNPFTKKLSGKPKSKPAKKD